MQCSKVSNATSKEFYCFSSSCSLTSKMISFLHILTTLIAFCGIFLWILIRSKPHTIGTKRSISIVFYFKWLLAYVLVRLGKRQEKIVNTEVMDEPQKLPDFPHVSLSLRHIFHQIKAGKICEQNYQSNILITILLFQFLLSFSCYKKKR